MSGWMLVWTVVLLGALTMFSGLTVAVTIGGFLDIRKMLMTLRRQHEGRAGAREERTAG
jgi:hypothetical protein